MSHLVIFSLRDNSWVYLLTARSPGWKRSFQLFEICWKTDADELPLDNWYWKLLLALLDNGFKMISVSAFLADKSKFLLITRDKSSKLPHSGCRHVCSLVKPETLSSRFTYTRDTKHFSASKNNFIYTFKVL